MKACLRTMEQENAQWKIAVVMEKEDLRTTIYSQEEVDHLVDAATLLEKKRSMGYAMKVRDEKENPAYLGCRSCRFGVANRILLMIDSGNVTWD